MSKEWEAFRRIESDLRSRFYGLDSQIEQILVVLVASHPRDKHMQINGIFLIGPQGSGKTDIMRNVLPQYFTKNGKPIDVFYRQIKPEHKISDVWFATDIFKSMKNGEFVYVEKATKADVVILDEALNNPMLTGLLNEGIQERMIDGYPLQAKFPVICCTNPQSDLYQTKIALVDYSTLDRFPVITFPSLNPAKYLEFDYNLLDGKMNKPIEEKHDLSIIDDAREQVHKLKFKYGLMTLMDYLIADLSYCKYTPEGEEDDKWSQDVSVWMMQGNVKQNCMRCRYGKNEEIGGKVRSLCNEGKVNFPRTAQQILSLSRAFAWFNKHEEVQLEDMEKAFKMVIPYKVYWFGGLWNKYHQPSVCFSALYESFLSNMEQRGMDVNLLRKGEAKKILLSKAGDVPTPIQGITTLNEHIQAGRWDRDMWHKMTENYKDDITSMAFMEGKYAEYKLMVKALKDKTSGMIASREFKDAESKKAIINTIMEKKLEENDEAELLKLIQVEMGKVELTPAQLKGEEGQKLIGQLGKELGGTKIEELVEFLKKPQKTFEHGMTKITVDGDKIIIETTKKQAEKVKEIVK